MLSLDLLICKAAVSNFLAAAGGTSTDSQACCILQLVRRWRLGSLDVPAENTALFCHHYPVRALASSQQGTLVSGDASGELAIWSIRDGLNLHQQQQCESARLLHNSGQALQDI